MDILKDKTNQNILLAGGLLLIAYYTIIKPVGNIFTPSKDEILSDDLGKKLDPYFNINFYKKGGYILTNAASYSLTGQIKDAIGIFYDEESKIYAAFKILKYKTQVSYLCYKYYERYNKDLLTDLKQNFNAKEMLPIYQHIDNLPLGR